MTSKQKESVRQFLLNFVNEGKPKRIAGGAREAAPAKTQPSFLKMANFVSDTLSKVLTPQQKYSLSMHTGDPKFMKPPMTTEQRAKVSEQVLNAILTDQQLQTFATKGYVPVDTLHEKQAQAFADLSAGYALGKVLNLNQFNDHVLNGKSIVTSLPQMQILRAGGIVRIPQIDSVQAVYQTIRQPMSKYMMNMGRYMSEPATNFLQTPPDNQLVGGGSKLSYFKSHLDKIPL